VSFPTEAHTLVLGVTSRNLIRGVHWWRQTTVTSASRPAPVLRKAEGPSNTARTRPWPELLAASELAGRCVENLLLVIGHGVPQGTVCSRKAALETPGQAAPPACLLQYCCPALRPEVGICGHLRLATQVSEAPYEARWEGDPARPPAVI
jgi:hypothetical protein